MTARGSRMTGAVVLVVVGALLSGCGDGSDTKSPQAGCADGHTVAGECIGVSSQPICDADSCTRGVSCAQVYDVRSDTELMTALGSAQPGSCIALAPGSYGTVGVPPGVSLLGKGADFVTVQRVAMMGGSDAMIRGMTISGGVELRSTASAHVDSVRIANTQGDGIVLTNDASGTITKSDIQGAAQYGVSAFGTGTLDIEKSYIGHGAGPGLWVQCADGCNCVTKPAVTIVDTALRDNKIVGISLVAAMGTFTNVEVSDNAETNFKPGGGISVSKCSVLTAKGVNVLDNSAFGVLLDHSSGTFGASGTTNGMRVENNLMGIWIQNLSTAGDQPVKLENCHLDANIGVGVGMSGESHGIIIYGSEIKNTQLKTLPVLVNGVGAGSKDVGDGLNWLDLSGVSIDGLTLSGNARASMLIDGAVATGSSLANILLSSGDETKGILQQNLPTGGTQPQLGTAVPSITANMGEVFAIPASPAVPSGI